MHASQENCRRVASDPVHEKEQRMRAMQIDNDPMDFAWGVPTAEELAAEASLTQALMDRDPAFEAWLRNVAVPAALELRANPSLALSAEEAREALAEMRRQRRLAT